MTVNPSDDFILHPDLVPDDEAGDEGGQPTESRKLAGKYDSVEELERGYQNLFAEGQRILAEKQRLEASLSQGNSVDLTDDYQPRGNPPDRRRANPFDTLGDAGVPVDAFKQAVAESVQAVFAPMIAGAQARETILREHPDFAQFEPEIAQFMESRPELKARFQSTYQADPAVAMEWAYTKFRTQRTAEPTSASGADNSAARLDARLPRAGHDRAATISAGQQAITTEELNKAMEYAQSTGDWASLIKLQANLGVLKNTP